MRASAKLFSILLLAGVMGACMKDEQVDTEATQTVRVGIGMDAGQLLAGSTYPLSIKVPTHEDRQFIQITESYDLELVDGEGVLKLAGIGGPNELTSITLKNGRVADMLVTVQNGRTDLHAAMTQAAALHAWFGRQGYRPGDENNAFYVQRKNGSRPVGLVSTFAEAEAAFLDPRTKLSEMLLFGLRKGDANVGVSLANTRRMRARQSEEFDDESNAAAERRYMLTMFITEVGIP